MHELLNQPVTHVTPVSWFIWCISRTNKLPDEYCVMSSDHELLGPLRNWFDKWGDVAMLAKRYT